MLNILNVLTTSSTDSSSWSLILFPIVMFGALWLFAIRPQKKREKEAAAMRNSIDVGDSVTTVGGITGRVISVKDEADEVIIETGTDKTRIRVKRWAISTKESETETKSE